MTSHDCTRPVPLDELVAYHRGELAAEAAERVEEAYFSCGACAERLAWIQELGAELAALLRSGAITTVLTAGALERAQRQGVRLRSYTLGPGGTVACTAAPDDDYVVVRLSVPAGSGESVSLETATVDLSTGDESMQRVDDVPVDLVSGDVVVAYAGDVVRSLPRSRWTAYAVVSGAGGERRFGPYVLDHTPWEELSASS